MWRRKKGCTEVWYLLWGRVCDVLRQSRVELCFVFSIPRAHRTFCCGQAAVEEALQEIYRLGKSCQLWLTKLWVTKSLYHCIFVLLFAQCAVKQVVKGDTNAIQLIFAMWYKNNRVRRLVIQKLKRDNLYRNCIGIVSVYSCLLSSSYIPFSFFDTKIRKNCTKYE